MSYMLPQPHTCPKCGYKCMFSESQPHAAPVLNTGPICPGCWGSFIASNFPVMVRDALIKVPPIEPEKPAFITISANYAPKDPYAK